MTRASRYVVLCLQGFGDALEATPLLEQLRSHAPSAVVTVVVMRPQVRDLYNALPRLANRVLYIPYWESGVLRSLPRMAALRLATKSDASFLTFPAARAEYAIFAQAIASTKHYAHDYRRTSAARWFGRQNTTRVRIAPKHNVLRNLDLLAAADIPVTEPSGYTVPDSWRAARTHPNRVIMHVGSIVHHGLEAKRWPTESFLELGHLLRASSADVVLLSGPSEREETAEIAGRLGDVTVIEGDVPTVARHVAAAGAVVANDNGIAHLAAGVGTPVVALMGPTPREFGPYGDRAVAFRPSPCPPCFDVEKTDMRCVLGIDYACLKRDIRVADVAQLVMQALGGDDLRKGDIGTGRTPGAKCPLQ